MKYFKNIKIPKFLCVVIALITATSVMSLSLHYQQHSGDGKTVCSSDRSHQHDDKSQKSSHPEGKSCLICKLNQSLLNTTPHNTSLLITLLLLFFIPRMKSSKLSSLSINSFASRAPPLSLF